MSYATKSPNFDTIQMQINHELTALDNEELTTVVYSLLSTEDYERLIELRDKEDRGSLTENERCILDTMEHDANVLTLRKATAAAILVQRGETPPTLAQLEEHYAKHRPW